METNFNRKIFSERLFNARKEKNLTQAKLGEMVDVSSACISEYENPSGKKQPTLIKIYQLANALGVSIDWLCDYQCSSMNVMALFHTLKRFTPEIKINEEGTLYATLEFKGMRAGYSQVEIANFLREYTKIQEIENRKLASKEMINQMEETLLKKFEHIPEFPPYSEENT